MSKNTNEQFLTPDQLAERWQVSRRTLYSRLSRREPMPQAFKLGNAIRFPLSAVVEFEQTQVRRPRCER